MNKKDISIVAMFSSAGQFLTVTHATKQLVSAGLLFATELKLAAAAHSLRGHYRKLYGGAKFLVAAAKELLTKAVSHYATAKELLAQKKETVALHASLFTGVVLHRARSPDTLDCYTPILHGGNAIRFIF